MAAFFWSLRHDARAAWERVPIGAWKQDVLALWPETAPLLAQINGHQDLVFAAYAHRTLGSPIAHKLAHVGDSWHCTSPQLGQGANMALLDAFALARALAAQDDLDSALGEYARMRAAVSTSGSISWRRGRSRRPINPTAPRSPGCATASFRRWRALPPRRRSSPRSWPDKSARRLRLWSVV
ncbi:MAG: FAD-dependent monooxygenase [Hyphomonadaceae bacterium]